MKLANEWKDYKILDMADGQKLEKWGDGFRPQMKKILGMED